MSLEETKSKMEKAIGLLRQDLATLKTGRANPSLVEQIRIEAYETNMPLVELATISVQEANQLVIAPFDQAVIRNIEKALAMDRGLGLVPIIDGAVIRVNIPPLTTERRQALVKQLGQKLEGCRIMIRQIRGDEMRKIKDAFENSQLSEDERFRQEEELQKTTDGFNDRIAEMGKQKEAELTSI